MPQHPGRSRDDALPSVLEAGREAGILPQRQTLSEVLGGEGQSADGGTGAGLGTSAEFFTIQDPREAQERIMESFRSGNAPFPIVSPSMANRDPLTISTDREQELIRQQAERQVQALRDIEEERQRRAERARQQTLLNLAGPTLFKAVSGRGVDTGLEEQMQLQREAERRAREIEEEATQEIPRLQTEGELQAERLERETRLTNEQARREQEAAEQQALSDFAAGIRERSSARLQAAVDRLEQQPGLSERQDALQIARDNPQAVLNNPNEIRRIARTSGTSPQLIRNAAEEALSQRQQEQQGGGTDDEAAPAAGVQTLFQDYLTLNQKKRSATDGGEWIEIDERQEQILDRIRGALGSEVGQIVEQWRSGNVTTGDLRHGIELIGQARAIGLSSNIDVAGESLSPTQVQDQLVQAIQNLQGRQGQGGTGSGFEALRQMQGTGQQQTQQAQPSGGGQQQGGGQSGQVTSRPSVFNQSASRQEGGGRAQPAQQQGGEQQQGDRQQPSQPSQADNQQQGQQRQQTPPDITVGDLLEIHDRMGGATTIGSATQQWLRERGMSESDIDLQIQTPDGGVQRVTSARELANLALNTGRFAAQADPGRDLRRLRNFSAEVLGNVADELTDFSVEAGTTGGGS